MEGLDYDLPTPRQRQGAFSSEVTRRLYSVCLTGAYSTEVVRLAQRLACANKARVLFIEWYVASGNLRHDTHHYEMWVRSDRGEWIMHVAGKK